MTNYFGYFIWCLMYFFIWDWFKNERYLWTFPYFSSPPPQKLLWKMEYGEAKTKVWSNQRFERNKNLTLFWTRVLINSVQFSVCLCIFQNNVIMSEHTKKIYSLLISKHVFPLFMYVFSIYVLFTGISWGTYYWSFNIFGY